MKISEERLRELEAGFGVNAPGVLEEIAELVRGYRMNYELESAIWESYAGRPAPIVRVLEERGFPVRISGNWLPSKGSA